MYAITGITGQVGGAVAGHLLREGASLRGITRNPEKAQAWAERGCALAAAEMTEGEALARAFEGANGVFVLVPPIFDPSPDFAEVRAVIDAVRSGLEAARPRRTVVLSTIGAQATEPNLLSQLGLMERELTTLGLPIAFLRAAWFMENAAWDVAAARSGSIESFLQPLDRAIPMVATIDVGQAAARLLQDHWEGIRTIELQGPGAISPQDIATCFAALLHRQVDVRAVPRESWEAMFRAQGMRNPLPRMRMLDGFNEGWIRFEDGRDVEAVVGATPLHAVLRGLLARDGGQ